MRLLLLCCLGLAVAQKDPIGKVVSLLGELKTTVQEEITTEEQAHNDRVKAQDNRRDTLEDSIADATRHFEKAQAEFQSADADVEGLQTQIEDLAKAIAQKEEDVAAAKAERAAAHKDFQGKEAELTEAVDTLARAKNILKKQGLGFAQVKEVKQNLMQVASTIELIIKASSISAKNQAQITAMLQGGDKSNDDDSFLQETGAPAGAVYESHSGNIIDLVAELEVEAKGELAELRKAEMENKHQDAMFQQGAADELKIMNRDLKNAQKELAVRKEDAAKNKQVYAEESASASDDSAELEELNATQKREAEEYAQQQKDREDEVAAVSKAVEILTADKFAGATKFIQMSAQDNDVRQRVAALLQGEAAQFKSRALAQLASRTRVGNDTFGKIRGMISDMITRLEEEAAKEASHNEWCNAEKKESDAKKAKLQDKIDELSARTDGLVAEIAQLKEDVATLQGELAASADAMATATKQRQQQADQFAKDTADYKTALEGLEQAMQALNEFFATGKGHGDAASSIIGILEVAQSDFSKLDAEARTTEASSAKAYKKMKNENEVAKAQKEAMIKTKNSQVKSSESAVADYKEDLDGLNEELDAVLKYLETVREKCTHKPQTFEERAAKMQAEIAGLKQALEILNEETAGGDAFLQKRMITKHA